MPDVDDHAPLLVHDRPDVGRARWVASLLLGTLLCLAIFVASDLGLRLLLGRLEGIDYALVGIVQAALVPLAVIAALKPVGLGLGDVGLRFGDEAGGGRFGRDLAVGLAVGAGFALLQFAVLLPATGGAERSDVVVNARQIGDSALGVLGFTVLAVTGGFAEELFFRGHFLTTLRNAMGRSKVALAGAFLVTVVVFALLHGYQGVAGVIDTGLYGGVVLTALYLWRGGRLTASVAAHATWNALATLGIWLLY